jgi:hypothetical protein
MLRMAPRQRSTSSPVNDVVGTPMAFLKRGRQAPAYLKVGENVGAVE